MPKSIPALAFRTMAVCAGGCLVFAAIITAIDVGMRGILNSPLSGAVEVVQLATGFAAFLSFPLCFHEMEHVTADLLNFKGTLQKVLHLFSSFVSVVFCTFLAWASIDTLSEKMGGREMTIDLSIPVAYIYMVVSIATVAGVWSVLHVMFFPSSDIHLSEVEKIMKEGE